MGDPWSQVEVARPIGGATIDGLYRTRDVRGVTRCQRCGHRGDVIQAIVPLRRRKVVHLATLSTLSEAPRTCDRRGEGVLRVVNIGL